MAGLLVVGCGGPTAKNEAKGKAGDAKGKEEVVEEMVVEEVIVPKTEPADAKAPAAPKEEKAEKQP